MTVRSRLAAFVMLAMLGCGASTVGAGPGDAGPTLDSSGGVDVHSDATQPDATGDADANAGLDSGADARAEASSTTDADATAAALIAMQVTPSAGTTYVGGPAVQYTATAFYSDGSSSDVTSSAAWSSSDTTIAAVAASTGLAMPLKQGVTVISAALDGKTAGAALVVDAPIVTGVALSPNPLSIDFVCSPGKMTATASYSDGTTTDVSAQAVWTSSDTSVATAGPDGSIACVSPLGSASISCTFAGFADTAVAVCGGGTLVGVTISPQSATVSTGGTTQFTALATTSDGETCDATRNASWTTVTPSVATIASGSADGGVATGVSVGSTVVEATLWGFQAKPASLLVTAAMDAGASGDAGGDSSPVTTVSVVPQNPSVPAGCTQQMLAVAQHADGSTTDATAGAAWSSSSTSTATIAPGGVVTCVLPGNSTISASYGGQTGQTTITCTATTIVGVSVTPSTSSILVGGTLQYTAYALFASSQQCDQTQAATWQSSAPSVASVVASAPDAGLATGLEAGTARITASLGGQTGNATLAVQ